MRAPMIVKSQIATDRVARLADAIVGSQVTSSYLTLRHRRSTNTLSRQAPRPSMLIATPCCSSTPVKSTPVNWLPWSLLKIPGRHGGQGLLQRLDAEVGFHRDRHPMRENPPAEHVDDRRQEDEATRHWDVGDVHRPHLIGPFDLHPAQQIRVDLVAGRGFAGVRAAIDGCDPMRFIRLAASRRPIETSSRFRKSPSRKSPSRKSRSIRLPANAIETRPPAKNRACTPHCANAVSFQQPAKGDWAPSSWLGEARRICRE